MNDFSAKVKAAEREAKSKAPAPQKTRRKMPVGKRWQKGQSGNPEKKWQPGKSANPGGRPSLKAVTKALRNVLDMPHPNQRKYKGMTRAEVLAVEAIDHAQKTFDLGYFKEILDRTEGKVPQKSELTGGDGPPIQFANVSPEENEKAIAALLSAQE